MQFGMKLSVNLKSILLFPIISLAIGSQTLLAQAGPIPPTLFGMHISDLRHWPTVPFGALGKAGGVSWPFVEPSKGNFHWQGLDKWVATAQSHGVSFYWVNALIPAWAASDPSDCDTRQPVPRCRSMVRNIQDWDDFITALATRYKGKLIYQLWNEPDSRGTFTGTPADLATLSNHMYRIIRSIDPQALILTPSTHPNVDYLDRYFAQAGPTGVDVVVYHYHLTNYGRQKGGTPEDLVGLVNNMKAVMAKYGLSGKPLWQSEGSWGYENTHGWTLPVGDAQGGYLARQYLLLWSLGVSRFYWFMWDSGGAGLWDPASGLHPAAVAYQQVYNWMVGATMSQPCAEKHSVWTCGFTRPGGYQALAVWHPSGPISYAPASQYAQYRDLKGNISPLRGSITIDGQPILLETPAPQE